MKTVRTSLVGAASFLILSLGVQAAIVDNFNDGNDLGWVRYNPVGVGTYSFPDGGYRVQASAALNPDTGEGRAGSIRAEESFSAFRVSVDVVDFDVTLLQAFGSAARIGTLGIGTTTGYVFVYDNDADDIVIARLDGEVPTTIGIAPLSLDADDDYRFVFSGSGPGFLGEVFDLTNGGGLFGSVTATDATYASGSTGLLVAALGIVEEADATFDNFVAVPEPTAASLLLVSGLLMLTSRRRVRR